MSFAFKAAHLLRPSGLGLLRAPRLSSNAGGDNLVISERVDSGIHVLTLNDETKANCLSLKMVESLHSSIKEIKALGDARVLVLRGAGRFFSAGHNLKELIQCENPGSVAQLFSACSQMMVDLTQLEIPSIAAVHGPAHAAGCQLVATCDLAVAGQSATFATSGVKLGLFCTTPAVALVRAIGLRAAKELLLTGRTITAERACALGLVHRVVPDDQVFEAGLTLAREIAQHSRPVVCLGKRAVSTQMSLDLPDAYEYATQVMLQNLELEDTKKGIEAFLNKQPMPQWTDKSD